MHNGYLPREWRDEVAAYFILAASTEASGPRHLRMNPLAMGWSPQVDKGGHAGYLHSEKPVQ